MAGIYSDCSTCEMLITIIISRGIKDDVSPWKLPDVCLVNVRGGRGVLAWDRWKSAGDINGESFFGGGGNLLAADEWSPLHHCLCE